MIWYVAPDNSQTQSDPAAQSSSQCTPSAFSKTIFTVDTHLMEITLDVHITDWSTQPAPVAVIRCTEQAGPKVSLPSDPLGLFSLFFDDSLVCKIADETNRYAEQCLTGTELRDYWSTDKLLHYAPIADRISRDHFEDVTRYLHFVDNMTLPARGNEGFSRLQKVEPVIAHLKARFKTVYYPHCQCYRKHHQLFFDNYFSSVSLLAQNTYTYGTIRTNCKNFLSEISQDAKKLQREGSVFHQCGNIVTTSWRDNKMVNVASTLASPTDLTTVRRQQKDGTRIDVECPRSVALYNQYMGGGVGGPE